MKTFKFIRKRGSAFLIGCLSLSLLILTSCEKFLEAKPDKSLAIPTSLRDVRAILDSRTNNEGYPVSGAMAVDDYYLTLTDWAAITDINARQNYIWNKDDSDEVDWRNSYRTIFNVNVVLDHLDKITFENPTERRIIEGNARFLRAFALYHLSQVFTEPLETGLEQDGLPLRTSADINLPIVRSSLKETYDFITDELQLASELLPVDVGEYKVRPSKAAAYAMLARVYLSTEDYSNAAKFADLALGHPISLMDYSLLDKELQNPFPLFNDEVIFHATTAWGATLMPAICMVDTALYDLYTETDYRKSLYFETNSNGSVAFKGHYHGQSVGTLFIGLATDEVYMISAEANAHLGNLHEAEIRMDEFLMKRYANPPIFMDLSKEKLLQFIRLERRKQLLMRGDLRWSDLRRFNNGNNGQSFGLLRKLDSEEYRLPPKDLRYTFLIPQSVIQESGIVQNAR